MTNKTKALFALGLILTAAELPAVTTATIALKGTTSGVAAESSKGLSTSETTAVEGSLTLTVTCTGSADCTKVKGVLGERDAEFEDKNGTARKVVLDVDAGVLKAGGSDFHLFYDGKRIETFDLIDKKASDSESRDRRNAGGDPIKGFLPCKMPLPGAYPELDNYQFYDQAKDRAWIVLDALGNPLFFSSRKNGGVIDSDDSVKVTVYVHPNLLPYLRVSRTSATRVLGGLNIAGDGVGIKREDLKTCVPKEVDLRDFASGEGVIRIGLQLDSSDVQLGEYKFAVSPVYRGMLSFGAISSDVVNDSFKLAPVAGQNVIVPGDEGKHETFYAVFFTPFVWGARDIEKKPLNWYEHINPSFGIVTNDLDHHALAGISVDWGAFLFTAGAHFARGTVLSSGSGLKAGDAFTGTAEEIPTAQKWKTEAYYGVSIDIRAAASLLKSAITGIAK